METQAHLFIILASLYLTTLLFHFLWQRFSPHINLPPGPRPLPIVGSLFVLGDKPHRSLAKLAKTYGPLMSLKLGQVTTIIISSPEMAQQVLQKKDQEFCFRSVPDASRALGHHKTSLAWLPVGQPWRELRKICATQLFSTQRMNHNQGLRSQKLSQLVKYLKESCLAGEPIDVGRAAYMTTLNLISNTLFSVDMVDSNSESAQIFRDLMWEIWKESGNANLSDFYPFLRVVDLQGRRRRTASYLGKLYEIFDDLIKKRLEAGRQEDAKRDFLDWLIEDDKEKGTKLSGDTIRSLLTDLFLAGSDSSSYTVEWAMAELLHNPSSMTVARAELARNISSEDEVDESDILQLPYLQAIVKETLRLHPPGPLLLPRKTEANTQLCGYTIPPNASVLVNAWAIGRDGEVWANPDMFMPERFLESGIDYKGQDFELIPFGGGRRICPGLPLASRIVPTMLASMLYQFNWKLPNGMGPADMDMTEKFGVTLAIAAPVRAIPFLDVQNRASD